MRLFVLGVLVISIIALGLGVILSLYTGRVEEIPKWNGMAYAMRAAWEAWIVLIVPFVVLWGGVSWFIAKRRAGRTSRKLNTPSQSVQPPSK
jgi:hypothetical protein